jgi:hypothetical protein
MKRQILLLAAIVPLVVAMIPIAAQAETLSRGGGNGHGTACSAPRVSAPPGAKVQSVTAAAQPGGTITFEPGPLGAPAPITDVPAWCDITVTLSHRGVGDHVNVKVSLPQSERDWNGRLQATGGTAYLAGEFAGAPLVAAVKDGYVGAATDAGIGQSVLDVSAWALTDAGETNTALLSNFASRSAHDMAIVAKDVAKKFYGKQVRYSYWNGCSTGGRQGYVEAQQYPEDFDGILANAPAVNWDRFAIATLWSQAVYNEEHVAPSPCEVEAFNTAAIDACDTLDGVADGVIDDPRDCAWDPNALVGTTIDCDGTPIVISQAVADAVRKIWEGPVDEQGQSLWYGPEKGASFAFLGKAGDPFIVASIWAKWFVEKDPSFDATTLTYERFGELFAASRSEFGGIIGSDEPDLSEFAMAGGKLLTWHGQADQLIPTQGTVDYRERVYDEFGGNDRVDDFYRLFLLPGVEHCGGGIGQQPTAALDALVKWVEQGDAPATLATSTVDADGNVTASREVCRYPQVTRYDGRGDPTDTSSYTCSH